MATKKDMRREDLIIPYQEPSAKDTLGDLTGTLASTLPMAAMFTRNKYIGWGAFVVAVQNWLSESPDVKPASSQPAYMTVGMSLLAIVVTYLPIFLPPPPTPTGAAPAAPPTT